MDIFSPPSPADFYANNLERMVNYRFVVKIFFALIFLTFAIVSLIFAFISATQHGQTTLYWTIIAIVTALMSGFIVQVPSNRRKLIVPSNLQAEINAKDYCWLETMCVQFPVIVPQVKNFLQEKNMIYFADFEKIWIKLGEHITANQPPPSIPYDKTIDFVELNKIKQRMLNM